MLNCSRFEFPEWKFKPDVFFFCSKKKQENENHRREVEQFRGKGFMSTTMVPTTTAQKRPATEDLQEQNKRQQHAGVPDETLMKIRQNLAWYQEQVHIFSYREKKKFVPTGVS